MPWTIEKTDRCPSSKPYGVIKEDGELEGCHETEEAAEDQQRALYASEKGGDLKHLMTEAKAVATEQGVFSALAATYAVDRVKDRIVQGAFAKTIEAWRSSGKTIPVHWDHKGGADQIIGFVDPASMRETDDGLYVEGKLDIDSSDVAKEAWRSMKNNAVALSFGYLPTKTQKGKNGTLELHEIDLFEVTVTPAPVNPDTRFLSLKSTVTSDGITISAGAPGWIDRPMDVPPLSDEALKRLNLPAVEDGGDEEPERVKSAPQDPLAREAWELITGANHPRSKAIPEPEPEPEPEPPNEAEVQREAWTLITQTSG